MFLLGSFLLGRILFIIRYYCNRMKKDGKSKSALKREAKEKELYESSWKLADSMYSRIWPERWESLKKAFFVPKKFCRFNFVAKEKNEEMEVMGKFRFLECEESEAKAPEVVTDKEALFLCNILNPLQSENVLGKYPVNPCNF